MVYLTPALTIGETTWTVCSGRWSACWLGSALIGAGAGRALPGDASDDAPAGGPGRPGAVARQTGPAALIQIKAGARGAGYHRRMRAKSIFAVPAGLAPAERQQRRHALVRLSLAWLAMMQVMMFAWPGYLRHDGIPADALETLDWAIVLMTWASFALTVPVVLYSAWPIWRHAGDNLRHGRAGMDVPVALGIVAAFIPSVYATYTGRGEVYFDSVTMFVAFLLTARYLELCARQSFGGAAGGLRHERVEAQRLDLGARADRLASRFVMIQVALALAAAAAWAYIDPAHSIPVMVALLVMSCPCAMSMAVPSAMASAIRRWPPTPACPMPRWTRCWPKRGARRVRTSMVRWSGTC